MIQQLLSYHLRHKEHHMIFRSPTSEPGRFFAKDPCVIRFAGKAYVEDTLVSEAEFKAMIPESK